jgi:hypothetical protein
MNVSVGQAAATAIQTWLRSQLAPDIVLYDRWPEANSPLFAPASALNQGQKTRAAISILRVGRRQRLDVIAPQSQFAITQVGAQLYTVTLTLGSYMQPVQLDIWATTDDDRDDIIAQLDVALNAGAAATTGLALSDNPVRDGVLLPLVAPFSGFIEAWIDEPEIFDDPDAVQRGEYRASYYGEARGLFGQSAQVSAISQAVLAQQLSALPTPPPGQLWNLATLNANGKVTYSTSSNP